MYILLNLIFFFLHLLPTLLIILGERESSQKKQSKKQMPTIKVKVYQQHTIAKFCKHNLAGERKNMIELNLQMLCLRTEHYSAIDRSCAEGTGLSVVKLLRHLTAP